MNIGIKIMHIMYIENYIFESLTAKSRLSLEALPVYKRGISVERQRPCNISSSIGAPKEATKVLVTPRRPECSPKPAGSIPIKEKTFLKSLRDVA